MLMMYILLGVLAAAFFGAGFCLHAFYFGDRRTHALRGELERLQKLLGEKQYEVAEAQHEISKTSVLVRVMEQQIRERSREVDGLQRIAARQDEEIVLLQRDADAVRTALAAAGAAALSPAPVPPPKFETAAPAQRRSEDVGTTVVGWQKSPEWRNNLDTILDGLDRMGGAIEPDR